jgi:hypothetical protein
MEEIGESVNGTMLIAKRGKFEDLFNVPLDFSSQTLPLMFNPAMLESFGH